MQTINCDICGKQIKETEIYVDRFENTICRQCHRETKSPEACKKPGCNNFGNILVGTIGERACRWHVSWINPSYMPIWWFWFSATVLGLIAFGILYWGVR